MAGAEHRGRAGCARGAKGSARCGAGCTPPLLFHLLLLLGRPSFYFRINLLEHMHFLWLLKEKIDI